MCYTVLPQHSTKAWPCSSRQIYRGADKLSKPGPSLLISQWYWFYYTCKCHFWQCVSVFLTFCSISARRRAWLRHHLSPLLSFIFHALCMSFLFLSQTKKLQNTTAFLLFIIFMNSTNVLIFGIPLSFLVTYFLLLTCCSAYDFNVVKKQRQ